MATRDPRIGIEDDAEIGERVVSMNFTASPESQWSFLVKAVTRAQSEEELGQIAAGPLEHLLGKHGAGMIDRGQQLAATDEKVARTLTAACGHMTSDLGRQRVEAIQARVQNRLRLVVTRRAVAPPPTGALHRRVVGRLLLSTRRVPNPPLQSDERVGRCAPSRVRR